MKKILLKLIDIYQNIPGNHHALCRYYPTCSEYTKQAIIEYGSIKGSIMGLKRIIRCNPFGGSGFDPVIKKELKNEKKI